MEQTEKNIIIDAQDVHYSYEEDAGEAVRGVTLQVRRGEFLCILGHNGSGKSTLAKLLNGLFIPTAGKITVCGMDTRDEEKQLDVRRSAGMVFQNPDNQLVATIVEEDVAFGPENLGVPQKELRGRVNGALAAVNMSEFARSSPHKLSGGQKQRIAIAGVLAMQPDIMIMDEPTAMLDPMGRREVINTVMRLNRQEHITVVLITHFMEEAALAERLIIMHEGKIAMEGKPRRVLSQIEALKDLSLEAPEAAYMAYSLNKGGRARARGCFICKGAGGGNMAIIIKELNYIYSPGTPFERAALKNINLTINDGEYIGLIGHTGSGKSTLIQHFNGLLKPSGGSLSVQGIELSAGKPDLIKLRSKVGLVFQYPEYQLFEESVAQDIAFGPKNLGLSEAEAAARVSEAMSLVGLPPEMGEKSPFELSGGQKRRAAVAGVIAMRPEVLVLDEPIAGLDPKGRREMLELIDGYRAKTGATIVLVSHNMDDVAQAADRVIVMSGGEIKKDGTPHEIFKDVAGMQELSLDVPQAALLADLLRSRGMPLSGNLISARELIEELIKHKDAILARRREAGK